MVINDVHVSCYTHVLDAPAFAYYTEPGELRGWGVVNPNARSFYKQKSALHA